MSDIKWKYIALLTYITLAMVYIVDSVRLARVVDNIKELNSVVFNERYEEMKQMEN